jgi:SAM-dependent methyltransferase
MVQFLDSSRIPWRLFEKYCQKINADYKARADVLPIKMLGSFLCHSSQSKILDCVRVQLATIRSFQRVFQERTPLGQVLLGFQGSQTGHGGRKLSVKTLKQGAEEASKLLPSIQSELRDHCLASLGSRSTKEMWDLVLKNQVALLFDLERQRIEKWDWWRASKKILEIGSGNGSYLHKWACQSREKQFRGIEMRPDYVKEANKECKGPNIGFQEGNAEVFDARLRGSADVVLFRLVLQYLGNPIGALQNAAQYISQDGHVVIIDACDSTMQSSHELPIISEAMKGLAKKQEADHRAGNRLVTLNLLRELETSGSPLNQLYEVVFTNLDKDGRVIDEFLRIDGRHNALYFNHLLLFSQILLRKWEYPIDLNEAYNQAVGYLNDDNAWTRMGSHLLILKKKQPLNQNLMRRFFSRTGEVVSSLFSHFQLLWRNPAFERFQDRIQFWRNRNVNFQRELAKKK